MQFSVASGVKPKKKTTSTRSKVWVHGVPKHTSLTVKATLFYVYVSLLRLFLIMRERVEL